MRRVRIDSNILGLFITGTVSFRCTLCKVPEARCISSSGKKYYFLFKQNLTESEQITIKKSFSHLKNMDVDSNYSDIFGNDDSCEKRLSTVEDVKSSLSLLKDIIEYRNKNVGSWIIETKVKKLCKFYKCFMKIHKNEFIQVLAKDYGVDHKQIFLSANNLVNATLSLEDDEKNNAKIIKNEEQLRNLLTPQYSWLFLLIGRLEKGVKFLVDLRTDVLELISKKNAEGENTVEIQQLNTTLRDLLSLWFSIGFLQLKRVTWISPCEMLQKISEYEAVHPVRNWTDLKRRVGPYRRCFVFLHGSMPGEPIVVLHTALCDEISSSMKGIVSARSRMSADFSSGKESLLSTQEEDPQCIKAAVFYSITSTQKGLQGIELGNYLIKSVVRELQIEFPQMIQFSSLSPIPNFKTWLVEKLKSAERGQNDVFSPDEIKSLKLHINSTEFWKEMRRLFLSNSWADNKELVLLLEKSLMRLCARYLFAEKRRGFALDSVANFHLRNGAVMWRINWLADLSPRGLGNSCSIMVNYRYFLDETETNSQNYLEKQIISASEQVLKLVEQAQQMVIVSKM